MVELASCLRVYVTVIIKTFYAFEILIGPCTSDYRMHRNKLLSTSRQSEHLSQYESSQRLDAIVNNQSAVPFENVFINVYMAIKTAFRPIGGGDNDYRTLRLLFYFLVRNDGQLQCIVLQLRLHNTGGTTNENWFYVCQ